MKRTAVLIVFLGVLFCQLTGASAKEIQLINGDKISGVVVSEEDGVVTLSTSAMGEIKIDKTYIKKDAPKAAPKKVSSWKKKMSLGYSQTGGNTKKSLGHAVVTADKKKDADEWNLKYEANYSSSDKKMDGRKFYGMGRYAYSFGDYKKWYNFFKLEGDQDRFANVDYRVIPSTGIGYWFADEDGWKLKADMAIGYEYTNYSDDTKSNGAAVLIPHAYVEKKLFDRLTVSEDLTLYPSLKDSGEFRLRSETAMTSPIADNMNIKFSLIEEYDSDPKGDSKKTDYRLISGLEYTF